MNKHLIRKPVNTILALALFAACTIAPMQAQQNTITATLSDQANIRYTINTDQDVVIRVIDLTGRVIDELQLGKQEVGKHLADWNGSSLDPGTYCLQLNNAPKAFKKVFIVR